MGLVAVAYQECEVCGYSWMSEDPRCPSEHCPTNAYVGMLIDWPTFWARNTLEEEWLVWPLVPVSRGVALYAPAKAGKSLVALALVAAAATGRPGLDGRSQEPVETLYLDYEMTLDDLRERLEDLGYGPDSDLSHLHYASLPSLPSLNTPEGAKALMALVEHVGARLVVIDTLGRAVDGDENEPRTVQDFYKWTGLALKTAGIAFLRVDHAGKDLTRGQRGHSAKNDDVDVVWQLTRLEGGVVLKCTHRRMGWVPDKVGIEVDDSQGWRLSIARDDSPYLEGARELAAVMDELDVPFDASRRTAERILKAANQGARHNLVQDALRWRRASEPIFGGRSGPRDHVFDHQGPMNGDQSAQDPIDLDGDRSGDQGDHDPRSVRGVPCLQTRDHSQTQESDVDLLEW